jgi:hypothetical protein
MSRLWDQGLLPVLKRESWSPVLVSFQSAWSYCKITRWGVLLTGVDSASVEENNLKNNLVGVTAHSSNALDIVDNLMTKMPWPEFYL